MKNKMLLKRLFAKCVTVVMMGALSVSVFAADAVPADNARVSDHHPSFAQQAFNDMLRNYYPLTPSQIHEFKNKEVVQAEANARPAGPSPAQGVSGIIRVGIKPGSTMPVIRVGRGMITSVVFTDKAGRVWPVDAYSIGDPSAFNIQWQQKSGVMMIQGRKLYAQTNMGVMLHGMKVPVMITLLVGQHKYDYQDYVRVQAFQPGEQLLQALDAGEAPEYLVKILSGLPPQGATQLKIQGGDDVKAWAYGGEYLLLTRSTLLSPEWVSKFDGTGPDPMHAYALQPSPVILLSHNGQLEKIKLSGGDDNA